MPKIAMPLIIRRHDPARTRRAWLLLGLIWAGSLLIVAAVVASFVPSAPRSADTAQLAAAARENESLKARIAVLERSDQVAKSALVDVQQSMRERDEEVDALRADLAFYGRLVGGAKREGLAVHMLAIKAVKESQAWNFVATLTQNFKRGQDVKGRLTLSVEGVQGGKLATLDWSALNQGQNNSGIEYGFKYFQQVSGTIMLPPGFAPNRVIVHADGDGGRADQEFPWKDAVKGEESNDVRQ
jgi:hypothetical protein